MMLSQVNHRIVTRGRCIQYTISLTYLLFFPPPSGSQMHGGFDVITWAVVSSTISSNIPNEGKSLLVSFRKKFQQGACRLHSICLKQTDGKEWKLSESKETR